ncbi:hypothetical protein [Treponema sp.]|uniref:hypothetical protein n=1 Tax=Treponema sp. TaxID=166 RepID=UPI00257C8F16|nr:hypothetical protein [Treponema sp.]MBE6355435.1 hypothetical protein [Treponema sp.]
MNFFIKNCRKTGFLILTAAFFLMPAAIHAEGISIEKVQNDPYFTNGSAFLPEDENGNPSNQQMMDPSDPDTFYNAENWPGGLREFDDEPSEIPEEGSVPDDGTGMGKGETVLSTDEETRANGTFNPLDAKFNFSASYRLFYSPTFIDGCVASYFDACFGFNFFGAGATAEYLFLGSKQVKFGIGAYGNWNLLRQNMPHYKLHGQQFSAGALFEVKVITYEKDQLNFHAGAGLLYIKDLQFDYENDLHSESTDWYYPELRLGFDYEYFIYDYVGFKAGADVVWPFLLEKFYPMLDVKLGIITRF